MGDWCRHWTLAVAGDDDAAVKTALDKLSESQQKIGEEIYAQSQTEQPAEGAPAAEPEGSDEDIVDAEVVDDEPTENK